MQVQLIEEIKKLRNKIKGQKTLIEVYEQMSHSLGGSDYSVERVDGSRDLRAPFEKWIYKKMDAEEKLKGFEETLVIKLEELSVAINSIESINHQSVLICRYLKEMRWEDIPSELGYSSSSIYRFHKEGLDLLGNLIVNESK